MIWFFVFCTYILFIFKVNTFTNSDFLLPGEKGSQLLYLIENYQVTIVVGQTGSGKTTRKHLYHIWKFFKYLTPLRKINEPFILELPQYLYEAGWAAGGRVVICTQVILSILHFIIRSIYVIFYIRIEWTI